MNSMLAGVASDNVRNYVYFAQQVSLLLGFLVISTQMQTHKLLMKRNISVAISMLFAAGLLMLYLIRTVPVHAVFVPVSSVCLGFLGGRVYALVAADADDRSRLGRIVGVGGSLAVLLQYILQVRLNLALPLVLLLIAGFIYVAYATTTEYDKPETKEAGEVRIPAATLIITTACLVMMLSFYETYINNISFVTRFLDWQRLLVMLGYLIIGFAFSSSRKGLVSLVMLCASLGIVVSLLMLGEEDTYHVHMSLFYLVVGAYIAYVTLMFLWLSCGMKNSPLWASMGRIIDTLLTGLAALLGRFMALPSLLIVILCLVLLAIMIVSLSVGGQLTLSEQVEAIPAAPNIDERLEKAYISFNLTERESEVLRHLVTTDMKNQDIADALYISRRQLQNHIASLYKKTGVTNRAALVHLLGSDI